MQIESLTQARVARQKEENAFASNRGKSAWIFTRPLLNESLEEAFDANRNSYRDELPIFNGQDIVQFIDFRVGQRIEQLKKGEHPLPISILDVGFGNGTALLDMKRRWGENVRVIGFGDTTLLYATMEQDHAIVPTFMSVAANAEVVDGNMIDAAKILRRRFGNEFHVDVIVSGLALTYLKHYPRYKVIKQFYELLNTNGVMFLASCDLEPVIEDEEGFEYTEFQDYITQRGYTCEAQFVNSDLALQKILPHLPREIMVRRSTYDGRFDLYVKQPRRQGKNK